MIQLVKNKYIQPYQLEKAVGDMERGVGIRRTILGNAGRFVDDLDDLPYRNYDYSKVLGSCCENVVGYVPVPVGVAGPLLVDGELVYVPMATTEGCLVASTNRGSRALKGCGVTSRIVADGEIFFVCLFSNLLVGTRDERKSCRKGRNGKFFRSREIPFALQGVLLKKTEST